MNRTAKQSASDLALDLLPTYNISFFPSEQNLSITIFLFHSLHSLVIGFRSKKNNIGA